MLSATGFEHIVNVTDTIRKKYRSRFFSLKSSIKHSIKTSLKVSLRTSLNNPVKADILVASNRYDDET